MNFIDHNKVSAKIGNRLVKNKISSQIFFLSTMFGLFILAVLLYRIGSQGFSFITPDFFTNFASRIPERAGIKAALYGTMWLMAVVIPVSLVLGVGTAIYLEEYAKKNFLTRFIQLNISNLAGVPSIVFGLLGLTVFVRLFGFERSILAGGLTMSLVILPVIVVSSQEAIRSVPNQLREASFALGSTKWKTIYRIVFPTALPGILTGSILAFSRAIGETAPLLVIGALSYVAFVPTDIFSGFTVMPIQIYNWTSRPQEAFQFVAAAGIIVLLVMLIVMNGVAVWIRNKFQNRF